MPRRLTPDQLARAQQRRERQPPTRKPHTVGKIVAGALGGLVMIIAIAATLSGGSQHSTSKHANAPTTTHSSHKPAGNTDAVAYVKRFAAPTTLVSGSVGAVELDLNTGAHGTPDLNQLASDAEDAHDQIDQVRDSFAQTTDSSDAQLEVFGAANDLKNAMGAIVAWTGNPNPATLAHATSQLKTAFAEWNDGVRTIWHAAHKHDAPTI
jgi:hypothetical protein